MMQDMKSCITLDEFYREIEMILKLSDKLNDGWSLKTAESDSKLRYLYKREVKSMKLNQSDSEDEDNILLEDSFEVPDLGSSNDTYQSDDQGCVITAEYHIVYSFSYNVPILYFNMYFANGKPLSLAQIWESFPDDACKTKLRTEPWSVLTQCEHPYNGRPFCMIHPCKTSDFMSKCRPGNYVMTWLSFVAPLVGFHLPNAYAALCCFPKKKSID